MRYKIVKKSNPRDIQDKKYYPIPVYSEEMKIDELAYLLSDASTVNVADVSAVLRAFTNQIPFFLQKGNIVDLEGVGRFKMSFSASGEKDENNVSASNITKTCIIFTPPSGIKKKLENASFTKA